MKQRPRTIVLTGATGFLGSHLMAAILKRGDRLIVFGRPAGSKSLGERIVTTLAWFGLQHPGSHLELAEVDLLKLRCGLEQKRYQALCAETDLVIHCASDTTFSDRNRGQSLAANVTSLNSLLLFASDCKASAFHYVSTAYSTGISPGLCLERPVSSTEFFNVYEETKAMAERRIADSCRACGIPFTIVRPSIVYGDSRSGRANRFNAIYHHVRSLAAIRDIYLNDIRNNGGMKSAGHGIRLGGEGILHLPIRLTLEQPGSINLIPVDYFVAATLAIIEAANTDNIYHLTNGQPSTTEELAEYCERFLNIRGLEITYGQDTRYEPSPAEELFNRFIEPYRPYLSDLRIFDRQNTDRDSANPVPPHFNYDIFRRCMEYAMSVDWGKKSDHQ
ncbi:oxidoreductase, SDR family [Geotalea daltonii FRC-32]|uniref:Oxidoreductase, SDR family n=1 Tax=Geotalea daltonii (strain DSM 22248 / JCM 15807 / FRC-32) TaxID=316067 RepID=B9M2E7_GEODF|nr:SDR family oxidoreductase [Geotalea daltonii]ACM19326.1 oxidoreductase, SDR family [Geotalea daltonii FRC-32]